MWRCEPCQYQVCQNCKEKPKLSRDEVDKLTKCLATEGLEDIGRVLSDARPLQSPDSAKAELGRSSLRGGTRKKIKDQSERKHPLDDLLQDKDAKMHVTQVADWLVSLEWPRHHDGLLEDKIGKCYKEAQRGELASRVASCANIGAAQEAMQGWNSAALRLEGSKTLKQEFFAPTYTVKMNTNAKMLELINQDGLVATWNASNPTMKIGADEQMVEINGAPVGGISSKKLNRLVDEFSKESQTLTLTVRRGASLSQGRKTRAQSGPPKRQDVFHQTFLQPRRAVDEATGKVVLTVAHETRPLTIGG